MAWSRNDEPTSVLTVSDALNQLNVDDLKKLLALLPTKERPTRKADLATLVLHYLHGPELREIWRKLDEKQQNAVSETLYSADGIFDGQRFQAKYGSLPRFGASPGTYGSRATAAPLDLFLYRGGRYGGVLVIPEDMKKELRTFVPKPAPTVLPSQEELPEQYQLYERVYNFKPGSEKDEDEDEEDYEVFGYTPSKHIRFVKSGETPLLIRETERAALQELPTLLRLIDTAKVAVSDKTAQPSGAAQKAVAAILRDGDFYEAVPKENKWDQEIGYIKAFAWPMLVQAGKLASLQSNKLALTKQGRAALQSLPAATLKALWESWIKSKLLDEFNRIEAIKGQYGKGKRSLTAAADRRAVIDTALRDCPVGRWIRFQDFSRYMVASALDFMITRDAWSLYISDQNYGSLGNGASWHILEGRYLLCLLFEYAATLGIIDLAYVAPDLVARDYDLWGADDLEFLSRYDGLQYFRLTPLGAYILGLTDSYTPAGIAAKASLTVMPGLQINVTGAELSMDEALLLESWATKESELSWRLDRHKILTALESGGTISVLQEFLTARDEQELPDTVIAFFRTTERNAQALKKKGTALLIECADAELAEMLATNEKTKKLCQRAGTKSLIIKESDETAFRKAAHLLGYGMPGAGQ